MINEKVKSFLLFQNFNKVKIYFFTLAHNNRGYGHLAVSVARNVPFAGALASKCTACPDSSGSASQ